MDTFAGPPPEFVNSTLSSEITTISLCSKSKIVLQNKDTNYNFNMPTY